jgi:hypothetical protein
VEEEKVPSVGGTGLPFRERSRICEVPSASVLLPHLGLADATSSYQILSHANAAKLLRSDGMDAGATSAHFAFAKKA